MSHYKLALLGFGNVGKAFAQLLLRKQNDLQKDFGITFSVTGIATGRHGAYIDPLGIDLQKVLDLGLSAVAPQLFSGSSQNFIRRCGADILFENSPVNYATGQPAVDHLRQALELGMHAITANKGPVVHAYRQLTDLAAEKGRKFYFESAVMDGAPIFSLFRTALPAVKLQAFRGILNSTTNYILSLMENGESFDQAVASAQAIGIAETDPSGDIDGWDASVKVAALATVLMNVPTKPQDVQRQGIRGLAPQAIADAKAAGKRWKLVCSARLENGKVNAVVAPEMVPAGSPLYAVEGTSSFVQFESDVLGQLCVLEGNPSTMTTAYGLLADFINAVR